MGGCVLSHLKPSAIYILSFEKGLGRDQRGFQFEIIINIFVSCFSFVVIHVLCVYGQYKYIYISVWGTTFKTSDSDV